MHNKKLHFDNTTLHFFADDILEFHCGLNSSWAKTKRAISGFKRMLRKQKTKTKYKFAGDSQVVEFKHSLPVPKPSVFENHAGGCSGRTYSLLELHKRIYLSKSHVKHMDFYAFNPTNPNIPCILTVLVQVALLK